MKKVNLLLTIVLLIGIIGIVFAVNFSNEVSTCDAEDTEITPGTFADACDAPDGSNLENDDGVLETHNYREYEYAGIRIESANTSVTNCEAITNVEICYEWWVTATDVLIDCNISVDANGGASYTVINTICPGIVANPGVNCINVTANESWVCTNFFTLLGTKGLAKSELTRSSGGLASTANWDVFFFNVSYILDTFPPVLNLAEPQNITYTKTLLDINFSVIDTNLDSCWYSDDGGITNITIVGCINTTYNASQGSTVINIWANDTLGYTNDSEQVTFFVDSISPLINYVNPTTNSSNSSKDYIEINITASDTNLLNITIILYNSTFGEINSTNSTTSPLYINFSTLDEGIYYFNATVSDILNNHNSTPTRTVVLDRTAPEFTLNFPDNNSISLNNYTLLNVTITDNLQLITLKIYGANESGFYDNNALLYKKTGIANGTEIVYNWTSPVLKKDSNTLLLMHFDYEEGENSTYIHDETGINNGTKLAMGAIWNESGKFGYAIEFGGDDEIIINDSNSLDLNESFSISFWAYPTNLSSNQTFLAKGFGTTTNYFIDYTTNNEIQFGFYNGDWRILTINSSNFIANQWNLISVTFNDSSNMSRIYINSIDKGSAQFNYGMIANEFDLKIGSFSGFNKNFTGLIDELVIYNKTLTSSEINHIYSKNNGNWYWQIEVNDSVGNKEISELRFFTIGSVWEVSPRNLGNVGTSLNNNVSIGTLFINNTNSERNITINISHDFNGTIFFNETFPLNLTNTNIENNSINIQINVTSPSTEGLTIINFNITATDTNLGEDSVPSSIIIPLNLIATSGNPFLITAFETAPSIVSQGNEGIALIASITNKGQGNAFNVNMTFELPYGWANSSGSLTSPLYSIAVNQQWNHSIEVNISNDASVGEVILYANVSGQNASGFDISSNSKRIGSKNITVNKIFTLATIEERPSSGGGGGRGVTSSGGGIVEAEIFTETIEIIKGKDPLKFDIKITPNYINTSLVNLTLNLNGFPEQYITISPKIIESIKYGESDNFTVSINVPNYQEYGEYELEVVISGLVLSLTGQKYSYYEKRTLDLIIQEVSYEESFALFEEAKKAIELMNNEGYHTKRVNTLLELAEYNLERKINNEVYDLSEEIIEIKNKAFFIDSFIRGLVEIEKNPKKSYLLTGNVVDALNTNDKGLLSFITGNAISSDNININESKKVPLRSLITGKVTFSSEYFINLLSMAIVAFDRGDYDLAEKRAKSAQALLILERKGNVGLFFYLYWHFIFILFLIFPILGNLFYKRYQKFKTIKEINKNNTQKQNIQDIMAKTQQDYFVGKISSKDYKKSLLRSKKHLGEIEKRRENLRNKSLKILNAKKLLQHLEKEKIKIESKIKALQTNYYLKRKISEEEYRFQFEILIGRLAEIEEEKTTIEIGGNYEIF